MVWKLISATPSPYARKVRVALQEKGILFDLQTEVPWNAADTKTPDFNPLEKLPVLILDDGKTAIYESYHIMEWLEAKHPEPALLPPVSEIDDRLFAKQVEALTDAVCDSLVLVRFEDQREQPSKAWTDRQMRKVEGGLRTLDGWVAKADGKFLIGKSLSLADIATVSLLGFIDCRFPDHPWQQQYPGLKKYWQTLDALPSFATTRPSPQNITDKIV